MIEKLKKEIKHKLHVARQDGSSAIYYKRIRSAGKEEAFKEALDLIEELMKE